MTRTLAAEVVLDVPAGCAEGPFWHPGEDRLYWTDIPGRVIHRFDPRTGVDEVFEVGLEVGVAVPRTAGGLVLAVPDGFGFWSPGDTRVEMVAEVEKDRAGNRMNEGKCDPAGRFWAGTMSREPLRETEAGALYRLDPDLTVTTVLTGLGISNGLDWTADGQTMIYVDSLRHRIDAYAFTPDDGTLGESRVIAVTPGGTLPDGLALDEEEHVWVALWDGSAVHRYAPDGTLDAVVPLPVGEVTSCVFGGPDHADLYITTAPGTLFRCRPGVHGRPVRAFAG
ncbi:SMP-30/gluconolactonase/LRE family protein [Rhizohabitans arisaemae]|uniref:SMP-30/gluconolactonase/LRE family protein n=1 Tax=Rhizohabitans arisaemae TaxID=2720610 RepID=UPI0024B0AEEC|nr:SMP-30/gluconolactonase/LRE family protein [Rhizohabitans arisaemae]